MKRLLVLLSFVIVSCLSAACSGSSNSPETAQAVPLVVSVEKGPVQEGPALLPAEADPEPDALSEEEKAKRIPVRVKVPAFEIDAPIEPVGLDNEGRVDTIPDAATVGWYKYGPAPGAQGNAILDGHRDYKRKLGALRPIERLKVGEAVTIAFADGSEQTFKVVSNNTYPLDDVPENVMELTGEARVSMITCSGKFVREKGGYQSRVVVVLK
ncbi:sortase [Cohnella sp. CFH 77786]|uniref:class F sortase n=1 Tax=Cohnella sp. CFH 77786 TaxID=2662265 RepID=UPI001C60B42A|nr:class F sortase [Cohnella sp. CFH 77786]MBW5449321.1 sortase [Cohnella sp. CFH 77786]